MYKIHLVGNTLFLNHHLQIKLTNHFSNYEEECNEASSHKLDLGLACPVFYHLDMTLSARGRNFESGQMRDHRWGSDTPSGGGEAQCSVNIVKKKTTSSEGFTSCKWPSNKAINYQWMSTGEDIVSEELPPYSVLIWNQVNGSLCNVVHYNCS